MNVSDYNQARPLMVKKDFYILIFRSHYILFNLIRHCNALHWTRQARAARVYTILEKYKKYVQNLINNTQL